MLLFLTHLQAGQVRVLQLHFVTLQEVLGHGAFHCLTSVQLQREANGKKKWSDEEVAKNLRGGNGREEKELTTESGRDAG